MTKEERYSHLRNGLTGISCSNIELNVLKDHFRSDIFSERRLERIINFIHLIGILEKRDVLSANNISCLKYIANVLHNNDILELIAGFNAPIPTEPLRQNVVAQAEPIRPNVVDNENFERVLPRINRDPTKRVYDYISTEIGQKWKEFARALRISEGYIDQLEYKYEPNIPEMAREVLLYHRAKCDPRYWQYELLNGLIDARRRDISIEVQRIFAMHSAE